MSGLVPQRLVRFSARPRAVPEFAGDAVRDESSLFFFFCFSNISEYPFDSIRSPTGQPERSYNCGLPASVIYAIRETFATAAYRVSDRVIFKSFQREIGTSYGPHALRPDKTALPPIRAPIGARSSEPRARLWFIDGFVLPPASATIIIYIYRSLKAVHSSCARDKLVSAKVCAGIARRRRVCTRKKKKKTRKRHNVLLCWPPGKIAVTLCARSRLARFIITRLSGRTRRPNARFSPQDFRHATNGSRGRRAAIAIRAQYSFRANPYETFVQNVF